MSTHKLAKSTLWLIASEIIFNLSGYVIHSAVGRILGPADYGRYGLVVTMTTMVIILVGNGIPTAMSKYISEIFETDQRMVLSIKRKAIMLQTALIAALTLLFFLSAPLIANALNDPSLTSLFRISSLIIPSFACASFYFSWYTGLHKFNVQSILKVMRSLMKVLAIVGLAWAYKVPGSIVGYALAAFSVFLVGFVLDQAYYTKNLKKAAQVQKQSSEQDFPASKLLNYAWQIILFFLAYELLISIDLYLVKGILHDDRLTGIYNASLTVGRIPYYIFYALTVMLLPVVSKATANGQYKQASEVVSHSLRIVTVLLVPSVILLAKFSEGAILFFYSDKYLEASAPMSVLAYGVGFLTIFYVLSFVLNGAGKTKISMMIAVFGFALNTVLNYFLIKSYGLIGSAIATSIASVAVMFIIIHFTIKDFGKLVSMKSLAKIFLAGLMIFVLADFFPSGRFSFIASSLVLMAIYLGILILLGELGKNDWKYVIDVIGRKKKKQAIKQELSGNEPGA